MKPGVYRHFKGGLYELIGEATHSETGEAVIVYRSLETGKLWARPWAMWVDYVTDGDTQVPRFVRVES